MLTCILIVHLNSIVYCLMSDTRYPSDQRDLLSVSLPETHKQMNLSVNELIMEKPVRVSKIIKLQGPRYTG